MNQTPCCGGYSMENQSLRNTDSGHCLSRHDAVTLNTFPLNCESFLKLQLYLANQSTDAISLQIAQNGTKYQRHTLSYVSVREKAEIQKGNFMLGQTM